MMNKTGALKKIINVGHALGSKATKAVRTAVYGTRPQITSSASTALTQKSAIGSGVHSVFDGPLLRKRGAPALKRERSA
jgi:hypothetical protein